MDNERTRKVQKGRERLEKYKKNKGSTMSGNSTPSDGSLSLSPDLLPERKPEEENPSGASSISEHISSVNSVENDRSFQEIEITNISCPLKVSDDIIAQEIRPSLNNSLDDSASKNAKSILEEILRDDQFKSSKSGTNSEVSLDIFEKINLDDSSINNYVSRLKSNEDSLDEKTLNENNLIGIGKVESLKDFTSSSFNTTLTEYKQYHEECANKVVEYESRLTQCNHYIEKLTESLQKSLAKELEWQANSDQCTLEIQELQTQLAEAKTFIKNHKCEAQTYDSLDEKHVSEKSEKSIGSFDEICATFRTTLEPTQRTAFDDLKIHFYDHVKKKLDDLREGEIKIYQDKMESEKLEYNAEIKRLKELLEQVRVTEIEDVRVELNAKYLKQMEDLRTYYEKKCADMEKNYSDEIFSQQSRKMSGSSTGSEPEFASDLIYGTVPTQESGCNILPKQIHHDNFTRSDLQNLKTRLDALNKLLNKHDVSNLSEDDFQTLITSLFDLDLKKLLKLDLLTIKNDLQTKYNAELEVLREEYENKIDLINIENEERIRKLNEEIEGLRGELMETQRNLQQNLNTAIQEAANSGEYELADIVKSYQIKLEEQVAIAKYDIITALKSQIQMLASNPCDDDMWPDELLTIKNCFTEKYEKEIAELKQQHEEEIVKLKEEHLRNINGTLERARRRSLRDSEAFADLEVIKERNNLKKSLMAFRHMFGDLEHYYKQCEDELNTTLVEELVKVGLSEVEPEQNINDSSNSSSNKSNESFSKRVHLTPNLEDFLKKVDSTCFDSLEFKKELDMCLERMKSEANAVFALTCNLKEKQADESSDERLKSMEERINSLTRQLITDSQVKEDLNSQLTEARNFVSSLEADRVNLEKHNEQLVEKNQFLENELGKARDKISELVECGRKEIVSEGYGETDKIGLQVGIVTRTSLAELQDRARNLASDSSNDVNNPWVQLVEELSREGERLIEDAKREREDFVQQIEAADKKLLAMTTFLEEQAVEREQERDEAQKDIAALKEKLRERDKDKASYERIAKEVEQLEHQMRDMSNLIAKGEHKYIELENEHKEAIDKIFDLRGIITDLEKQIDTQKQKESESQDLIVKLKDLVTQQREVNDELSAQIEKNVHNADLHEHIKQLEEEVQRLRLTNELAGNEGVLKQIKLQLHEIEITIDKSTTDLENSQSIISTTSCSSPSEEMSIRDQIRPQTPSTTLDECEVPLQQLARLKEKLIKHSRAEHAAVKKIRDLEMQLVSSKHELDEVNGERDVLQQQISEQLVIISSLQMRLEDQRLRAEFNKKQNNAALEAKIYDLENELQSLRDTLQLKESTIKQLTKSLEQSHQLLQAREEELCTSSDEQVINDLQLEIARLKNENAILQTKIESDAQNAQILPSLVDNILADKNRDIELLRSKLSETEKQLERSLALNLGSSSLKKGEERGLLTFMDLTEQDQLRRDRDGRGDTLEISGQKGHFQPEISSIECVGPPNIHYTVDGSLIKPNSTEILRSSEKHVHFQEESFEELKSKILELDRSKKELEELHEELEKEKGEIKNLRLELAEVKMHLMEKDNDCAMLQEDMKRKDDMYFNLAKEKRNLEKQLEENSAEKTKVEEMIDELTNFKLQCAHLENENIEIKASLDKLIEMENSCRELAEREKALTGELNSKKEELRERDQINAKLEKEVANKIKQIKTLTDEMLEIKNSYEEKLNALKNQTNYDSEIERLKTLLVDRECELEILNEDIARYQNEIESLEKQVKAKDNNLDHLKFMKQKKELAEKNLEIVKLKGVMSDLNNEIIHLQDYLSEKDKIIEQMKLDAESLRINLETIRSKMNETGNVVELREKLNQEKQKNAILKAELQERNEMITSIDDISEQVQKQLDYSAHLDETILNAISSGDFASIDDIEILRRALSKERQRNNELKQIRSDLENQMRDFNKKLSQSIQTIKELKVTIEKERKTCSEIQIEDANLLEQMRVKLEAALENETEFEQVLLEEKRKRTELEQEIANLRQKKENLSSTSSKTEYKSLPDIDILRMKNELQTLTDENQRLKKDVKNLKRAKSEVETGLKYTKDMLNLKCKEVDKLEKLQTELTEEVCQAKEAAAEVQLILEQRLDDLERAQIEMDKMGEEKLELEMKVKHLKERVKFLESEGNNQVDMNSPVPEKFLQKMKDVGELVTEHLKENKILTETIAKLTEERTQLQDRVRDLELRCEIKVPFDDPVARANHLFAKYLRANSYKNALAWQKKYLVKLLATYQEYNVDILSKFEPKHQRKSKLKGIRKFKSYVYTVIAVIRMKYLVLRWHSGTRGGAYTTVQQRLKNSQQDQHLAANFQVGQPVSSQHFSNATTPTRLMHSKISSSGYDLPRNMTPPAQETLPPWSGFTPPSKDRGYQNAPTTSLYSSVTALPDLTRFVERFRHIQQTLGLAVDGHNT